jgi:cytidine deaminase
MAALNKTELIAAALDASRFACAPYSKFNVGAALLLEDGCIVKGANVESVSYGLTCCAERVALFKALTEGKRNFQGIAIVAPSQMPMPCGACRQLLAEYAPKATVLVADSRRPAIIKEFTVKELLPRAFTTLV